MLEGQSYNRVEEAGTEKKDLDNLDSKRVWDRRGQDQQALQGAGQNEEDKNEDDNSKKELPDLNLDQLWKPTRKFYEGE